MKLPPLLAGYRRVAWIVAAVLVISAGVLAYHRTVTLTVSNAAYAALASLIGTALTAFFWVVDRRDRLQVPPTAQTEARGQRERADAARRADGSPRLEVEMILEDAGGGYKKGLVRLINHGWERGRSRNLIHRDIRHFVIAKSL